MVQRFICAYPETVLDTRATCARHTTNLRNMDDQPRRRALGPPAARSVLLTVLGEYVLPSSDGVWHETLIGALGTLEIRRRLRGRRWPAVSPPTGCARSATAGARGYI